MHSNLLIVFAKNPIKGIVKTRLAKTVGEDAAFEVYRRLLTITKEAAESKSNWDLAIYFTDHIDENWNSDSAYVQVNGDLGDKMKDAFQRSFESGYKRVIGIGTDLAEMNSEILSKAFNSINFTEFVFGPASDGGYYLLGMNQFIECIFDDKPWGTESLLDASLQELEKMKISHFLLPTLNDIDTLEDLKKSPISAEFEKYY